MLIDNPFDEISKLLSVPCHNLSEKDWDELKSISRHPDYEVRLYLTENLADIHCPESEALLLELLNDDDSLVVASACDSLSFSNSLQVLTALKTCTCSANYIVRGFAYLSIGEVLKKNEMKSENYNFLLSSVKKEKSKWVKASIAYALCLNESSDKHIIYIEELLSGKRYNFRISALNLFDELLSKEAISDKDRLVNILLTQSKKERNKIVLNKINSLLNRIGEN